MPNDFTRPKYTGLGTLYTPPSLSPPTRGADEQLTAYGDLHDGRGFSPMPINPNYIPEKRPTPFEATPRTSRGFSLPRVPKPIPQQDNFARPIPFQPTTIRQRTQPAQPQQRPGLPIGPRPQAPSSLPQQAGGLFGGQGPSIGQRFGARPQGLPSQATPSFNPLASPQSFLPGLLPNQALQRNRLLNRPNRLGMLPNFERSSPWRPSFAPQGQMQRQGQPQPFASPWLNNFNRRFF